MKHILPRVLVNYYKKSLISFVHTFCSYNTTERTVLFLTESMVRNNSPTSSKPNINKHAGEWK